MDRHPSVSSTDALDTLTTAELLDREALSRHTAPQTHDDVIETLRRRGVEVDTDLAHYLAQRAG